MSQELFPTTSHSEIPVDQTPSPTRRPRRRRRKAPLSSEASQPITESQEQTDEDRTAPPIGTQPHRGAAVAFAHGPSDDTAVTVGSTLEPMSASIKDVPAKVPSQRRRRSRRGVNVHQAAPVDHYPVPTTHRPFAHPTEGEFTGILDFYGVQWLYEPRSFPLRWDGDRVVEMFTPDFYLPEVDLYVELTTLKQSLVTDKNRKLRHIKELYPEINIKLLYRRDIHRLLAKYGFGPLVETNVTGVEKILYSKRQIEKRVIELGSIISSEYSDKQPILIGVLRGAFCFMADLMHHISLPVSLDFVSVSYYGSSNEGDGVIQITKEPNIIIAGQDVLLVEDIVDTGMTLHYLLRYLQAQQPASIKVCTLIDKRVRRLTDIKLDYVGFDAPDEFLVGYGLDYLEKYRNMPFIGILRPGEQPQPSRGRRRRNPK